MAHKKVGGKNKPKDDGMKGKPKSTRSNIAESGDKSDSGGGGRVLRPRTATKGGGNIDEKAKGKKPMAEEGNLRIDSEFQKGKNAGKRKVTAEEENAETAKTPAKRIRNADKNEEEKSNLEGTDRVLRPRNVRKGDDIVGEKAKGKKSEAKKSASTYVGVGRSGSGSAAKGKPVAEEESAGANVSYNLRARRGVPSFQKVDLSESGFVQVVGKRVKVFWSSSRKWITGKIESYDEKQKLHKVLCDDGDLKELDLKTQRFVLEVMPGEAFTLSSKHKLNAKKKQTHSYGGSVDAGSVKKGSLGVGDARPVKKHSEPTRKVATRAAKRGHSKLQQKENTVDEKVKCQKGKKITSNKGSDDTEETDEEMDSDGDVVIANIVKKASRKVGNAGPEKNLPKQKAKMAVSAAKKRGQGMQKRENCRDTREASLKIGDATPMVKNPKLGKKMVSKVEKRSSTRSQKRENTEEKAEDVASKKTVSKGQVNVERRKNPAGGRAKAKTKK